MALLINCEKCGQMHLQGVPCRPEAIFNKREAERRDFLYELERRLEKLEREFEDFKNAEK